MKTEETYYLYVYGIEELPYIVDISNLEEYPGKEAEDEFSDEDPQEIRDFITKIRSLAENKCCISSITGDHDFSEIGIPIELVLLNPELKILVEETAKELGLKAEVFLMMQESELTGSVNGDYYWKDLDKLKPYFYLLTGINSNFRARSAAEWDILSQEEYTGDTWGNEEKMKKAQEEIDSLAQE